MIFKYIENGLFFHKKRIPVAKFSNFAEIYLIMVRTSIKNLILESLNSNKIFTNSDFNILFKGNVVMIKFEHNENYEMNLAFPNSKTIKTKNVKRDGIIRMTGTAEETLEYEIYEIKGSCSPGKFSSNENIIINGDEYEIRGTITEWIDNILEELKAEPLNKIVFAQEEEIEKIKKRFDSFSEDFFSKEEIDDLTNKLEILENTIKETLEKHTIEAAILNERLNELEKEIDSMKQSAEFLNKKSWFKSSFIKIYKWVSEEKNRKLIKDGAKLAELLMPDQYKLK